MSEVRSVFNLAVSCHDTDLKRAACNSLLQMLDTIIKRVTIMQFQLRLQKSMDSALSPKTPTGDDRLAGIQGTGNDSPKSKEPLEGSESPAPGSEHRAPVLYSTEGRTAKRCNQTLMRRHCMTPGLDPKYVKACFREGCSLRDLKRWEEAAVCC
ncbi:hypothetical protein BSKO_14141 [Bryopsis sp. KO-2023]|nr:hypothetical protein BSKO_14141 [Bryopsis sp. KO-2023]